MARVFVPIAGTSTGATRPHPYGRVTNRIITRGMGPHINRLIMQGYGGPPTFVIAGLRQINLGQSGTKRRLNELDEVIIWAKLIEVNNRPAPPPKIQGFVRVRMKKAQGYAAVMAEHIASRSRAAWETIKVSVQRLK